MAGPFFTPAGFRVGGAFFSAASSQGRNDRGSATLLPGRMLCCALGLVALPCGSRLAAAAEGGTGYLYNVTGNNSRTVIEDLGDVDHQPTGLTKTGSGRLTLVGNNRYTGPTDIAGGRTEVERGGLTGSTMSVGGPGKAYVWIMDKAHVIPQGPLVIGPEAHTVGAVTVRGASSRLDLGNNLISVGELGTGYLNVRSGAEARADAVYVGRQEGNTAPRGQGSSTIYVGAANRMSGGRLTVGQGGLWIGPRGNATVGVTYGGVLESDGVIHLGSEGASYAFFKIGESPAEGTGTLIAGDVRDGSGTVQPGIVGSSKASSYGMVLYGNGIIQNRAHDDLTIKANINFRDDGSALGVFDTNGQITTLAGSLNDYGALSHGKETGGFAKTGQGTLYITNHDNGYTGPTQVREGTLALMDDGANISSMITVSPDATLTGAMTEKGAAGPTVVEGDGTISANWGRSSGLLTIGATGHQGTALTMGTATGTPARLAVGGGSEEVGAPLHIHGQGYDRTAGIVSTVAENVDGVYRHLQSSVVRVNGDAVLNNAGIAFHKAGAAPLTMGDAYQVLTATGTISATHENRLTGLARDVLPDTPFISPYLVFEDHALDIVMRRNGTAFSMLGGETRNESTTARTLDAMPVSGPVVTAMANLGSANQARQALDNLSGELHASLRTALIQDSFYIRNAVLNRLANSDCTYGRNGQGVYDMVTHQKNGPACSSGHAVLWGQAYGGLGHNGGDGNAALVHHNTAGFVMGMDAPIHHGNWRAGGLVSYGHSMFDIGRGRSSSASSSNITVGGYAGTHWGRLHLRLGAAYSWNVISTRRQIAVGSYGGRVNSGYLGGTAQGFGELGYRLGNHRSVFEPFMNVAYVNMQSGSYREHGNAAALRSRGVDNGVTFSSFGFRASTRFSIGKMVFMPHVMGAYRRGFGRLGSRQREMFVSSNGAGGGMDVAGVSLSSNAAIIDTGLTAKLTNRLDLDLSYIGQYGNRSTESGATGSVHYHF